MEIALILSVSILLVTAMVFLSILILLDPSGGPGETGGRLMSEGILFYSFSFIFVLGLIAMVSSDRLSSFLETGFALVIFSFPVIAQVGYGLWLALMGRTPDLKRLPFSKSIKKMFVVSFEVALILTGVSILVWRLLYRIFAGA